MGYLRTRVNPFITRFEAQDMLGGYEAETIDLFNRMDVRPDENRRDAINTLIAALKTAGVWSKLDGLYMFAAHSEQAALVNWRRDAALMTAINAPVFTVDVGFTGDGVAASMSNVDSATSQMVATSAAVSLWVQTRKDVGSWDLWMSGWNTGFTTADAAADPGNSVGWRVTRNASNNSAVTKSVQAGLYVASRVSSTDARLYKDGSQVGSTDTNAHTADTYVTTSPLRLFSTNGTENFTDATYSFCSYGAGMTAAEAALFYNAVNTYMSAVGLPDPVVAGS